MDSNYNDDEKRKKEVEDVSTTAAKMAPVEILCIGNELLSGITLNTNAHWICSQIEKAGGTVVRVTVVRDELDAISKAVKETLVERKPSILVTTGGLGATYDDMTLEGVARALGSKVVLDRRAAEMLKNSYKRRNLHYRINKVRLKMATIPEGSTPIENPVGSAPSVTIDYHHSDANYDDDDDDRRKGKRTIAATATTTVTKIFCVPGVPVEMKAIIKKYVLPLVRKEAASFVSKEANYLVKGVSEGMIAPALIRIVDANPRDVVYLKTHPRGYYKKTTPRIRVHLVCKGTDENKVGEMLEGISKQMLREIARLGGIIENDYHGYDYKRRRKRREKRAIARKKQARSTT